MKLRPRKFAALFLGVCLTFLFLAGGVDGVVVEPKENVPGYSYDSPMDPAEFQGWTIIDSLQPNPMVMMTGLKDPNSDAVVMLTLMADSRLPYNILGYHIYKNGKLVNYWLDVDSFEASNGTTVHYELNTEVFKEGVYNTFRKFFFDATGVQLPEQSPI